MVLVIGICVLLFIGGIILWVLGFKSFKKRRNIFAILFTVIGLFLFIPPAYMIFRIASFGMVNNYISRYEYAQEFTQINHGFSAKYASGKRSVNKINIKIDGFISGKGELFVKPYEKDEGIKFILEGNIGEELINMDWYNPECSIEFIPENEFVDGNIIIKIGIK